MKKLTTAMAVAAAISTVTGLAGPASAAPPPLYPIGHYDGKYPQLYSDDPNVTQPQLPCVDSERPSKEYASYLDRSGVGITVRWTPDCPGGLWGRLAMGADEFEVPEGKTLHFVSMRMADQPRFDDFDPLLPGTYPYAVGTMLDARVAPSQQCIAFFAYWQTIETGAIEMITGTPCIDTADLLAG